MLNIKQIRDAVKDRLVNANIDRVKTISVQRATDFHIDELPALAIYTRKTPFEGADRQPRYYQGETTLVVESVVHGDYDDNGTTVSPADQCSLFSEAIVTTLIYPWDAEIVPAGTPLSGPFGGAGGAEDVILEDVSSGSGKIGSAVVEGESVTFTIPWQRVLPGEAPPDDFLTAHVEINPPEDKNAEDLNQTLTIPQRD